MRQCHSGPPHDKLVSRKPGAIQLSIETILPVLLADISGLLTTHKLVYHMLVVATKNFIRQRSCKGKTNCAMISKDGWDHQFARGPTAVPI